MKMNEITPPHAMSSIHTLVSAYMLQYIAHRITADIRVPGVRLG